MLGRAGKLSVQCFPVGEAAAHELWPGRDSDTRIDCFRQKTPKLWMMPAKVVAAAIPMRADSGPQPPDLHEQCFAVE